MSPCVHYPKKEHPEILWLDRARRERRGTGTGRDYIPWIQIRRFDLNSRGRSHVIYHPKSRRQHHLLSDLELHVLFHLIWSGALDIREQFPLSLDWPEEEYVGEGRSPAGTIEIATQLGYRHPLIKRGIHRILTTDFVVTTNEGYVAIYAKYSNELEQGRCRRLGELLEIAKEYWLQRNVKFIEVTERDLSSYVVRWCIWCYDAFLSVTHDGRRTEFVRLLHNTDAAMPMGERLKHIARWMSIEKNECGKLLKQALMLREVAIDFFRARPNLSRSWDLVACDPNNLLPSWHFLSKERLSHV